MDHLSAFKIGSQKIFEHIQAEKLEYMHILQNIFCASGVPGQQLLMGQLDPISAWDEIPYGKDCVTRYSFSRCSLPEQWQLE